MDASIVKLSAQNARFMENIEDDVFDGPIKPEYLKPFLDDPRHVMFLAVKDDCVVGMVSGFEYFHPDKPPQLFINEVGVAEGRRRRGIGRALVKTMVDEAKQRRCVYAWLGTDADNIAGQACFSSAPGVAKPQKFLLYEWELDD